VDQPAIYRACATTWNDITLIRPFQGGRSPGTVAKENASWRITSYDIKQP